MFSKNMTKSRIAFACVTSLTMPSSPRYYRRETVDTERERVEAIKEQAREVVRTREPESLAYMVAAVILGLENTAS
jgi:hypothetical protein